jgi:hypothetical protein
MCDIQEEILKIISPFSNVYSKCQLEIMQCSYEHLKCLPDIYNMSTLKQASFTVTPPPPPRCDTGQGGMCNPGRKKRCCSEERDPYTNTTAAMLFSIIDPKTTNIR